MRNNKLYIVMVGLPARGKSTIAYKLKDNLTKYGIRTGIFNNGDLRRRLTGVETSRPEFYSPDNRHGVELREKIAVTNMGRAADYLTRTGYVAILDATNVSAKRREKIIRSITDHPIIFIECINEDEKILKASIQRKISNPEFSHLTKENAIKSFRQRMAYYEMLYTPIETERNYIKLDSLNNKILAEEITDKIPYWDRIRDFLVTDTVKNLFLLRHGETHFNLENRIGGDSELTENGLAQAKGLARYFQRKKIPVIFTSEKRRTIQTAVPIKALQKRCTIIPLEEFNEIESGICECMSYEEIRDQMPHVFQARKKDKYNYVYPSGEGYVSMKHRVDMGLKKALYLSSDSQSIIIVGHRAVNRMILSHFLYRREEDVPYIYVPQDRFYHVVVTQDKKLLQLKPYTL
ncbi:MAG: 6-phosphofructo-2-kinase/fructose-2,6-bisphosphatase [Deltaproteobacteria bacterium]|nr:6-phosphofructo-2-kinase/fructose-2,6-bisphosphatase [Deltaproteobacteria bacterium]